MQSLHQDPWFTFRFTEDRIIPRFHLEGVGAGQQVSIFKIDPGTGERLELLGIATVGGGGWVDLPAPIVVRAGEAFVAMPEPGRLNYAPDKVLISALGVAGALALVGYVCGLARGGTNSFVLAVWCGAIGGCVVLLGYGPIALVIGLLGAVADKFRRKKDS